MNGSAPGWRHGIAALLVSLAAAGSAPLAAQGTQPPEMQADLLQRQVVDAIHAGMAEIPGGTFQMGDLSGNGYPAEKPVRAVTVRAFRLSKHEVTFEQYDAYAQATGRPLPNDQGWGRGNRPVIDVSWDDAQAFIAWLNEVTGLRYRLPTEAEWEYAARAGSTTDYPWGNDFDASKANGSGMGGADNWANTAPVGSFQANAWGLHDMIGNVMEWIEDCWNSSYNRAPSDGSAWMSSMSAPSDGSTWTLGICGGRVFRGGAWFNNPADLRVSFRFSLVASSRYSSLGFRLAQDL